jgi:hypothetical protein
VNTLGDAGPQDLPYARTAPQWRWSRRLKICAVAYGIANTFLAITLFRTIIIIDRQVAPGYPVLRIDHGFVMIALLHETTEPGLGSVRNFLVPYVAGIAFDDRVLATSSLSCRQRVSGVRVSISGWAICIGGAAIVFVSEWRQARRARAG